MNIEKINDNVFIIDTLAYGEPKTVASYLVKSDDKFALIDVGYAYTHMNIINALQSINLDPKEITYIIPTHVHLDHSGATGHIARIATKAKIVAHERAKKHLIDPTKLILSAKEIFGEEKMRVFGTPLPVEEERIISFKEELELKLGNLTLRCIYAPGHAPHQMAILLVEKNLLFTADTVGIMQPNLGIMIPTTPPPSFDFVQATKTLDNLKKYDPAHLTMPHYGYRGDPEHVFDLTKTKMEEWINAVKAFVKEGLTKDEIIKIMQERIKKEANISDLPASAKQSILISVSGILNYISNI
ncbi:MAG TPA: MBL fold metallo-hydrolase [Geobacterales bacterium]|nr:MBL fold metallo-hydrolase [Geobacterales bacterium]